MKKYLELKLVGIYLFAFTIALLVIVQFWFKDLFTIENLLNWDAEHYHFIKEKGYQSFRVAFFPLFPLLWRLFSVDPYLISIFNALLFASSFIIFIKQLKITNPKEILFYLSIPSFIFFYLPYTESLFFLSSILIIIGLKDNKDKFVYIGLFLSILTRPAFTIFVPALIITELLNHKKNKTITRILLYVLITIIGMTIVAIIQYIDTGEWFKYFGVQSVWGNKLQWPKLPLRSWSLGLSVRTEAYAFFVGILSGLYLLMYILKVRFLSNKTLSRELVFSLAYIGGITLSVLMFRGGSLFSLNRFVFAAPFVIVLLNYWIRLEFTFSLKQLFALWGLIFLFWILFGSYVHIQVVLMYLIFTFYVWLLFVIKSENQWLQKIGWISFICINFIFQLIFYIRFLSGEWVG